VADPVVKKPLRASFAAKLQLVQTFYHQHGYLPTGTTVLGPAPQVELSRFITHARDQYSRGVLSQRAVDALNDAFGDAWKVKKEDTVFTVMLARLHAYVRMHGTIPPAAERQGLGKWIRDLKEHHDAGRLSQERRAALEYVPGWVWTSEPSDFEYKLKVLLEFTATNGRLPREVEAYKGVRIGRWVGYQRKKYRLGSLTAEQLQVLEEVEGWTWKGEKGIPFAKGLQAVQQFVKAHGRLPRRSDACRDPGVDLHSWIVRQRFKQQQGRLSPQAISALEEVPGWGQFVTRQSHISAQKAGGA
jgi:hypothetical protein